MNQPSSFIKIQKYTSVLLATSLFSQSFWPIYAIEREPVKAPLTALSQEGGTAAGILHYALHDNEIHVLLGQRNDSKHPLGDWCNFGGSSEEAPEGLLGEKHENKPFQPSTLSEDAARESAEESNGIYAPHPRILRHAPFIDVLTEKSSAPLLYRMYWQQVRYIDPAIFLEKSQAASFDYNKEYTGFMWVKASGLLTAAWGRNPVLQAGEIQIHIYGPLFDTLSTVSGIAFLNQLSRARTLKTTRAKDGKYSSIRSFTNLLYYLGGDGTPDQFYALPPKYPAVVTFENHDGASPAPIIQHLQKDAAANRLQDAIFRQQNPQAGVFRPNNYDVVPLRNIWEENDFAQAVAAHGMAMVELKRRFARQHTIRPLNNHDNVPLWNPNCDESISRIHLRIALGLDYKTPDDFRDAPNPRREADLANIKKYFSIFRQAEYDQKVGDDVDEKDRGEFKRQIHPLDSDYELFADALAFEEENKQWPTFYHGASENLNNLFKSFTYLRELIALNPLNGLMALRGTDIYFKGAKAVQDFQDAAGNCRYEDTQSAMLCTNFSLFAGLKTTVSTSSSAEYVLNDHSVDEPDLIERFEEALALAGFSKPVYDYYQSLFEQYIKYKKTSLGNSVLLALSQNPEGLDACHYATWGGGHAYTIHSTSPEGHPCQKTPSTSEVLNKIQGEYDRQIKEGTEAFDKDADRKRGLFPENRILLHPHWIMNPSNTKMRSFDRFPLNPEEQRAYGREMRAATVAMLADWLAQKSTVIDGAFLDYPALKTLYKRAYKGVAGQDLRETFCVDGFVHLVRNGHLQAVKGYIDNDPDVLNQEGASPEILLKAALDSNNPDQIDYFLKRFGKNINDVLAKEDFLFKMRELLGSDHKKTFFYFLKNYDLSLIDDSAKLYWVNHNALKCYRPNDLNEYLRDLHQTMPHFMDQVIDNIIDIDNNISHPSGKEHIIRILETGVLTSQNFLEKICLHIHKKPQIYYDFGMMETLIEKGVDIRVPDPDTQEPVAFTLATALNHTDSNVIKNLPYALDLLDLKNKAGLTLMQFLQKTFLEGQDQKDPFNMCNLFYSLQSLQQSEGRDYCRESYPPFIEAFGELKELRYRDALTSFENRHWIDHFQKAQGFTEVQELVDHCPDSRLLSIFAEKIKMKTVRGAFEFYYGKTWQENKNWLKRLEAAIRSNDRNLIDDLKASMPSGIRSYCFDGSYWPSELKDHIVIRKEIIPLIAELEKSWKTESDLWLGQLKKLQSEGDNEREIIPHIRQMSAYTSIRTYNDFRKYPQIDPYSAAHALHSKERALYSKEQAWIAETQRLVATQQPLADWEQHLNQAPDWVTLSQNLGLLPEAQFTDLLPKILEKFSPEKERFFNENKVIPPERHDIKYLITRVLGRDEPRLTRAFVDFLGIENIPLLVHVTDSYCLGRIMETLSPAEVEHLFSINPDFFTYKDARHDCFVGSLTDLPMALKKKLAFANLEKLKDHDASGNPYFWCFLENDSNLPLVQELLEKDPSLLRLKTSDGLSMEYLLNQVSKNMLQKSQILQFLKQRLAQPNTPSLEAHTLH